MSNFTIERLAGEPILIIRELESYDASKHIGDVINAVETEIEHFDTPGYAIIVSSGSYNLAELMVGAKALRERGENIRNNPNYRGTLFVTEVPVNKMALENLSEEAMGSLKYTIFDNLDDALAFARSA